MNRLNEITIKKIGEDIWGRRLYENVETGMIYADVDGHPFTTSKDGEPSCPLRYDLKITILEG